MKKDENEGNWEAKMKTTREMSKNMMTYERRRKIKVKTRAKEGKAQ